MKPLLFQQLEALPNPFHRRNVTREFLQARILLSLQDHGAFANWAFLGGTALRFLFGLPRYSEDLDFSLAGRAEAADFEKHIRLVQNDLRVETYAVESETSGKAGGFGGEPLKAVCFRSMLFFVAVPGRAGGFPWGL